ncbi:uncharacterized protein DDB_G0290685-like [Oreochromis niloticus]|uniref:uncharacterized protein DDB_G0290685-like n=1 Tax=Oreochromis niloticus TaxID=8128 RepID=UPI0009053F77|nr:uncharacterized protein DDB_G0290685-like [Oreochromis niloticus]
MSRKPSKDKPKEQNCTSKKTEAPEKKEAAHELECWSQTSNRVVMEEVKCGPNFFSQKKTFYNNSQCHITMNNVGNLTLTISNGMINVRNNQFDLNNRQFPFIRNPRAITDKPRTAIDNKDCDSTQSTSENSEDKEKHEKDCDCTQSTSENSENAEEYEKDCDCTQSTSENSEDKEKHEKDCDCTQSTSENSEDKEKHEKDCDCTQSTSENSEDKEKHEKDCDCTQSTSENSENAEEYEKDCDCTQSTSENSEDKEKHEKDCDCTQSTSENSEDKEKHEKDCDCTQSTSENSEDKEKYRFSLEICLEKLVEQIVKKLGIVISPERVLAIYNRLTNKIWAEIRDDIDKIPLKKFNNFHKVMYKALCKKWKDPELILQIMELNYPTFDDKIVNIFMEEAAKLSKKPGCIRRFFSFIGRLFCCTRRQNKADVM